MFFICKLCSNFMKMIIYARVQTKYIFQWKLNVQKVLSKNISLYLPNEGIKENPKLNYKIFVKTFANSRFFRRVVSPKNKVNILKVGNIDWL